MKITIELPDTTALGFLNISYVKDGVMMLGSFAIASDDLKNGYLNIKEKAD